MSVCFSSVLYFYIRIGTGMSLSLIDSDIYTDSSLICFYSSAQLLDLIEIKFTPWSLSDFVTTLVECSLRKLVFYFGVIAECFLPFNFFTILLDSFYRLFTTLCCFQWRNFLFNSLNNCTIITMMLSTTPVKMTQIIIKPTLCIISAS